MLLVADVLKEHQRSMTADEEALWGIDKLNVPRSAIPSVTHVHYSARLQTVHAETNPMFHRLLTHFDGRTGCPVLVNTSFNVRGEPIVCSPEDAFRCFMGSEIEVMAAGNCFFRKQDQLRSGTELCRSFRTRLNSFASLSIEFGLHRSGPEEVLCGLVVVLTASTLAHVLLPAVLRSEMLGRVVSISDIRRKSVWRTLQS